MTKRKRKGWRREPVRHSLASKGVKTTLNSKGHTQSRADRVADAYVKDKMDWKYAQQERLEHPIKKRIIERGGNIENWVFEFGVVQCPHGNFVFDLIEYEVTEKCPHGCDDMVTKKDEGSDTKLGDLFSSGKDKCGGKKKNQSKESFLDENMGELYQHPKNPEYRVYVVDRVGRHKWKVVIIPPNKAPIEAVDTTNIAYARLKGFEKAEKTWEV